MLVGGRDFHDVGLARGGDFEIDRQIQRHGRAGRAFSHDAAPGEIEHRIRSGETFVAACG